jgi:hypothetical protein
MLNVFTNHYKAVTETITFHFVGDYSQVGRPIPDAKGYKKVTVDSSSLSVKALTPGVTTTSPPTITRNKEDDTTFILFNFRGPSGGGLYQFQLDYTVDGPLADESDTDYIYWSYKFNVPINNVDLNYGFPFSVSNPGVFSVDQPDVTARTPNSVRVQRSNIPSNVPYALVMSYPHSVSNTATCTRHKPGVVDTLLTIILVCVFVGLCVCITIICSIWGAIRRGLLWGNRFGYNAPSYGYATSTYYEPQHHHHHHSSGGGGSSYQSGITGSSGFAN